MNDRQRLGPREKFERFNTTKADGTVTERLHPPADHTGLARTWLAGRIGEEGLRHARLTFRHDPGCPRLTDIYGLCTCRPEFYINGQRLEVPSSVYGDWTQSDSFNTFSERA